MQPIRKNGRALWCGGLGLVVSAMSAVQVEHAVNGSVEMKSALRAEVRAPVAAFVKTVHVTEGDQVYTGTNVAELAVPNLESLIAREQAKLHELEAELRLLQVGTRQEEIDEQQRKVSRLEQEVHRCQQEVNTSRRALQERMVGLDQQSVEWMAKLRFARANYERRRDLIKTRSISEEKLQEAVKEIQVGQARLGQIRADKRMYSEQGTTEADGKLARARKDLAEAQSALALLQAGARPEEVEAAQARRAAIQEELRYLQQLKQRLMLNANVVGVVTTAGVDQLEGTYVREGDLICTVEDPSVMEAEIMITEDDASRVHPGQAVRLKLRGLPYQLFRAEVEKISEAVRADENGGYVASPTEQRMMVVRCRVTGQQTRLHPGMTGYAKVSLGRASLATIAVDHIARFVRREFWW